MLQLPTLTWRNVCILIAGFIFKSCLLLGLLHWRNSAKSNSNDNEVSNIPIVSRDEDFSVDWTFYSSNTHISGVDLTSLATYSNKRISLAQIKEIESNLSLISPQWASHEMRQLNKQPWIVLGSPGTGTRVIHDFLAAFGVEMSEFTNDQKDSRIFIELVKKAPFFSSPPDDTYDNVIAPMIIFSNDTEFGQMPGNFTLMKWISRSGLNFETSKISPYLKDSAVDAIRRTHAILTYEIKLRTGSENSEWGYKEPQAMFVLPFLADLIRENVETNDTGQKLKIVHVIRDGRDIAFSKQHLRKYQKLYTAILILGIPEKSIPLYLEHAINMAFSNETCVKNSAQQCIVPPHSIEYYKIMIHEGISTEWLHRIHVAQVWARVNIMVKRYAFYESTMMYIPIKLEDVCSSKTATNALHRIIHYGINGGLKENDTMLIRKFVNRIDRSKCRLKKYSTMDPVLVMLIEGLIHKELLEFGFNVFGRGWKSVDELNVQYHVNDALETVGIELFKGKEFSIANSLVIFTYVTREYETLLLNWLKSVSLSLAETQTFPNITILISTCDKELLEQFTNDSGNIWKQKYDSILATMPDFVTVKGLLLGDRVATAELSNSNIWAYRMKAAISLIQLNNTVILSDVDALFIKSPLEIIEKSQDIVASRGRFPYSYNAKWGATVCMGWILLKPSSLPILYDVLMLMSVIYDDQIAVNTALDQLKIKFETKEDGYMVGNTRKGSIGILPFETVPRFCKDDLQKNGISYKDRVDDNWIESVYSKAVIVHCYLPKDGEEKEHWFKWRKLWFIM